LFDFAQLLELFFKCDNWLFKIKIGIHVLKKITTIPG
jgi:hypothetical protein